MSIVGWLLTKPHSPGAQRDRGNISPQSRNRRRFRLVACGFGLASLVLGTSSTAAFTPKTQLELGEEGSRFAPVDAYRQIEKHKRAYQQGILAPFQDNTPRRHYEHDDGEGLLIRTVVEEAERAVEMIRSHRPFEEIVRQFGVVAHFVADSHNPLNSSQADAQEERYYADYLRYVESAENRFPLVFYGTQRSLGEPRDLALLTATALRLGRKNYPLVGREYRRIDFQEGRRHLDDRSTAFAVSSVAFSRAATDIGLVLRYIWLRAGGGDPRGNLPQRGGALLTVPRHRSDDQTP